MPCGFPEENSTTGTFTIIDFNLPRLQQGELVLPLQQRRENSGLYSYDLTLPSPDKYMAMSASSGTNLWHRRMGHLDA